MPGPRRRGRARLTPSTERTGPASVSKWVRRWSTSEDRAPPGGARGIEGRERGVPRAGGRWGRASRRPSPMRLTDSTVAARKTPATTPRAAPPRQPFLRRPSSFPNSGSAAGRRRERRVASGQHRRRGDEGRLHDQRRDHVSRTWRYRITGRGVLSMRAASTYCRSRKESDRERTSRTTRGTSVHGDRYTTTVKRPAG